VIIVNLVDEILTYVLMQCLGMWICW